MTVTVTKLKILPAPSYFAFNDALHIIIYTDYYTSQSVVTRTGYSL